ncbi:D-TA family PLP-dependent enzyme [soil metagenome]
MVGNKEWYSILNIDNIDSPALVVYPDRVFSNIRKLKSMVKDVQQLRPHVKTHKMLEVVKLIMEEGILKFKCSTIAEAEMLGMAGAQDVLLAYQPVGPKIKRLAKLIKQYPKTKFFCLIDSFENVELINKVFEQEALHISVYVDVNVGMNRTGILPDECALQLYSEADKLANIKVVGLHIYDGHIRDQDFKLRKLKSDQAFEPVKWLISEIVKAGKDKPLLVAGGSPTFPVHALRQEVECSPGTFVFWDWGYHTDLKDQDFKLAALVITRVISIINSNTLCLDLGHKSVASENPLPRVHFLNEPDAEPVAQSEEHLVVKVADAQNFKPGDVFYGVPYHICPTCALYEKAYIAENQIINSSWEIISRNRYISI